MTREKKGSEEVAENKENFTCEYSSAESSLLDEHHHLVNVVELLAEEKVDDVIKRMDTCSCSQCRSDVLALALNNLPTKYVTSDAGKQYIQLSTYKKQFEMDVIFALMKACMKVNEKPNHDKCK